jgi:hypothetical protein
MARIAVGTSDRLERAYNWLAADSPGASTGRFALVVVLGYAAHAFRKRKRRHYGAFEVGAAIASGMALLADPHREAVLKTCGLLGVIYFFVRGQDNYDAGLEQDQAALDARIAQSEKLLASAVAERAQVLAAKEALDRRVAALLASCEGIDNDLAEAARDAGLSEENGATTTDLPPPDGDG